MATMRNICVDENEHIGKSIATRSAVFKKDAAATGIPSRPALGNLVNRAIKNTNNVPLKKSSSEAEPQGSSMPLVDLKKVKPRVDTWRVGAMPTRKLTRSNSIKVSAPIINTAPTMQAGPRLLKARTSTIATLQGVKYTAPVVLVEPVAPRLKSPAKAPAGMIRRQESNLSRKSLTKLKTGDKSTTAVTKTKTAEPETVTVKEELIKLETKLEPVSQSHSQKLLYQFNDIDADDDLYPLMVSEYVNDIYSYLNHLEVTHAIRENHLEAHRDVYPKMRSVLIDWINEVHLQYRFTQETFHMTVSIIDRYLQVVPTTSRQNLQLVGITALFIASKYEELYPPEVKEFVYITDDTYTKAQVLEMEKHILKKLKFELGCPLSIHFLRRYSKAAESTTEAHTMAKYFLELSTVDYKMCQYLPSEVAAASLFISLYSVAYLSARAKSISSKNIDANALWTSTIQYYSTYELEKIKPIVQHLAEIIVNAPKAKLNNVYTKYSSVKMNNIALTTDKCAAMLQELSTGNF